MYRFIRTATVKTGASQPPGLQFAGEVTAYVNKAYALNMKYGTELFGECKIHWHFDIDSLDKGTAIAAKLMQDREYAGMLEKSKGLWLEGSLKDTIVTIVG